MNLHIHQVGLLTSLQDTGRIGHRAKGVSVGGVMDTTSAQLANFLVGNEGTLGVLEIHPFCLEFDTDIDVLFSVAGAVVNINVGNQDFTGNRAFLLKAGTRVKIHQFKQGYRVYLAIRGGFDIGVWLRSQSTYLAIGQGGWQGRKIEKGDSLPISQVRLPHLRAAVSALAWTVRSTNLPSLHTPTTIHCLKGMAWGKMADEAKVLFENQLFEITPQSNRMGYRLKSEPLTLRTPYVNISSAVDFGTVQLLPSGQLIVLMADAQTTGGYPAIAQVIKADLPLLAQLAPLSVFYFKIISIEEAERKSASQQQRCRKLRCACSFRLADENIL